MWDGMGRRACRCMRLRLTARKAICMGRRADRRRCDRHMEERGRRGWAGTGGRGGGGRGMRKEGGGGGGFRLGIWGGGGGGGFLGGGVERLRRAPLREIRV